MALPPTARFSAAPERSHPGRVTPHLARPPPARARTKGSQPSARHTPRRTAPRRPRPAVHARSRRPQWRSAAQARSDRPDHRPAAARAAALATLIARAQTHHDQQREIGCSTREITKPRERGIVSPLSIIDDYHQRPNRSAIRAQPVQPVNRGEPIGRRLPSLHTQRPRTHPRNPPDQPTPLRRRRRTQHRLEQLTRDPERHLRLKFRPSRQQHSEPARPRTATERSQHPLFPIPAGPSTTTAAPTPPPARSSSPPRRPNSTSRSSKPSTPAGPKIPITPLLAAARPALTRSPARPQADPLCSQNEPYAKGDITADQTDARWARTTVQQLMVRRSTLLDRARVQSCPALLSPSCATGTPA